MMEASPLGSIWTLIERLLREVEDEFQDYDTPLHPQMQKYRDEIKKTIEWIVPTLEKSGTPQMGRIAQVLKKVPTLPSEQVMPTLQQAFDELHKAKRNQMKVRPADAKAIADALLAVPSMMKAGAALTRSSSQGASGDELWQTKMKGYFDDTEGFKPLKRIVHPTGQDVRVAPKPQQSTAASRDDDKKSAVMKRIQPTVRKKQAGNESVSIVDELRELLER